MNRGLPIAVLVLGAFAESQEYPYQGPAAQAAAHLLSLQQANGSFAVQATENHQTGYQGIIGLALLSEQGFSAPVEKLTRFLLGQIGPDGNPGSRTYKADFENGYVALFLAELALQEKHGMVKLDPALKNDLLAKVQAMVGYFVKKQDPSGTWVYTGGNLAGYKEVAPVIGILDFYRMADALGVGGTHGSAGRAVAFMRSRLRNGGFMNGDLEKDASIHMTPACVAVLHWWPDLGTKDLVDTGNAFNAGTEARGYLSRWKYDEFERIPPNLQGQAKMLVERRQMYGLFHLCLAYRRARVPRFEAVHKQACGLLLANSNGGTWSSTLGSGGATAFALLTLNVGKDSLVMFWPDPKRLPGAGSEVWLGARLEKTKEGLAVREVYRGSAASGLGLREDDILVSLNGRPVAEPGTVTEILAACKPGGFILARFRRKGKEIEKKAKLQKVPPAVTRWDAAKRSAWQ